MHRRRLACVLLTGGVLWMADTLAQVPLGPDARALRSHLALEALDRYLETWNTRDPGLWAASLNFPHVRPSAGRFAVTTSPQAYAAGVDFARTLSTGWHHTEWVTRDVLQVGVDKVHVAGRWQRYAADDRPLATSVVTYVVTRQADRWGVQARFGAGRGALAAASAASVTADAVDAVQAFVRSWNAHDPERLAAALHYPHVRLADGRLRVWDTRDAFLEGSEPGRQRTWFETRLEEVEVVQAGARGANVTVTYSRRGRDGLALSTHEAVWLVTEREGTWKIQARSSLGT